MGVKDLWDILSPVADSCSLDVLKDKTVAIDLSGWILKSQKQKELCKIRYAHLRNLFFRTSHLLKLGAKPLFIIEGEAPALKREVLFQRIQSQEQSSNSVLSRKRFRQVLHECQEMIESLGLTCVQSSGEAEATCAYLNMNKVVDGCITDDSDVFLYGAQIVYRNFSIDPKDPHIDVYKMADIESKLSLDRRRLVALALLLGCDYCQAGVPGVGKEKAMELLENLKNVDALERFEKWRNGNVFASVDTSLIKKHLVHCEICKHPGTFNKHLKDGCTFCGSTQQCMKNGSDYHCDCPWHQAHKVKLELSISEKALKIQDPEFPSKEIIKEFLEFEEPISCNKVQWNRPSVTDFEDIITKTLNWTVDETRKKIFPLITFWQILQIISKSNEHATCSQEINDFIMEPARILNKCVRKFVECFIVEWNLTGHPAINNTIITTEVQNSFKQAYPRLTENYYSTYQTIAEKSRKRKEKGLSSKIFKKSSKHKKSIVSSGQGKKVSKDKQGMALSQIVNRDSVSVKGICAPKAQKFNSPEVTRSDSLEMFNLPLSQRLIMKNMSKLFVNKDLANSLNKSSDYSLKNELLQASCTTNVPPPNIYDVGNKHFFFETELSLFGNDKTNERKNQSMKQSSWKLPDAIMELADKFESCKLFDNTSSICEFSEQLIAKNDFKNSIICVDSESDDDTPKQRNETFNDTVNFIDFKKRKSESKVTLSIPICSIPTKNDYYECSPLPLRERLKHKYL